MLDFFNSAEDELSKKPTPKLIKLQIISAETETPLSVNECNIA